MSDGNDIVRLGWLKKSPPPGAMNRWKRRFFCFRKGGANGVARLEYYPDGNMTSVKGVINLNECSAVVNNDNIGKHKFLFRLNTAHRVFLLEAASEEERVTWVDALSKELFQNNDQPAVVSTVPVQQTLNVPSMPHQLAPRRTSISVKRQPSAPNGSCERPHHPQPIGPFQWLYGAISRQQTEGLLADYGLPSGLFLVRQKPGSFAISVCAQGKIVHHLLSQQVDGSFSLNGKLLAGISSMEEVVEYLETPKGAPLNWRQSLTYCPKEYDARNASQQQSSSAPPPLGQRKLASESKQFTVTIVGCPDTQCIGVAHDQPCHIVVGGDSITVLDTTSNMQLGTWPLDSVYDYGCDSGTFFFKSNTQLAPGHFRFLTGDPFDIMTAVRTNLPPGPSTSRTTASVRVPGKQPQINAKKFSTLTSQKPPKVVPRQPSIKPKPAVVQKSHSMASIVEEDVPNDYEDPIDDFVLTENEGKPLPPVSNATGTGKFDKSFLDKMNSHLQQPPQLRPKPAVIHHTEEENPINKRVSVQEVGVAVPGFNAGLDLGKALSGLKKTSTIPRKKPPSPPKQDGSSQQSMMPMSIEEEAELAEETQQAEETHQVEEVDENEKSSTLQRQDRVEDESGVLYVAGCDYDPNGVKGKLGFKENDVINILKCDNESWWLGELNGQRGWVPASFMDPLPEDYSHTRGFDEEDDPETQAALAQLQQ
eukprot:m.82295 g.82295  ORF g.82295 m.82295 type:complete len:705 (+) comp8665_c4_seq1:56-2170(+)